jgi:hypothetical protein
MSRFFWERKLKRWPDVKSSIISEAQNNLKVKSKIKGLALNALDLPGQWPPKRNG